MYILFFVFWLEVELAIVQCLGARGVHSRGVARWPAEVATCPPS